MWAARLGVLAVALVTLVGVWAISRGVNEIFAGFTLRQAGKNVEHDAGRLTTHLAPSGPPPPPPPPRATRHRRRPLLTPQLGSRRARAGRDQNRSQRGNPALLQHLQERAKHRENRVAGQVTRFAGSSRFVYIHLLWFSLWTALGVEDFPFGLLTMIVSLEAIFLSAFVMISQNRADEKRQVIAGEAWRTVRQGEQQNERLLRQSDDILRLTSRSTAGAR